ncbi:MAG: VWA domain-containing protein [Devosia sp.]|uniref:VWA domain-containing protein n=1 Tax=Devosia sp. TaxID=1871048 RepID=UPI0019F7112F|nr:VWA domain-containing protein [Devosia sp.]MBF0678817.1 VWA domain-containing protein [Devosia sp.]
MMGFAAPLFGLLVLAAGYVWFLHSRREYRQVVPSLAIWQQLRNNAGFKRKARLVPPITLALVLQLIAVALLAAALTAPFWGRQDVTDHLVVVVDTSATRGNADAQTLQLADALAEMTADFTGRGGPTPKTLTVITGGPLPHYIAARWSWQDERLHHALTDLKPTDGATDWAETTRLIEATLGSKESTEVLTIGSRGQMEPLAENWPELTFAYRSLAAAPAGPKVIANLTLTDADKNLWTLEGEAIGDAATTETLFVHYATAAERTPLDWAKREIKLGTSGRAKISVPLEFPGPGIVTVSLGTEATQEPLRFIADAAPQTLDVLYIGERDQLLLKALNAVGGTQIFRDTASAGDGSDYGLIVVDGARDTSALRGNVVSIEADGPALADVDPDFWVSDHPMTRDIDWSSLTISAGSGLTTAPDDVVLLAANGVALMTAATTEHGRKVRLGFDPAASNWPELYAFPVFVSNLIDWMGVQPGGPLAPNCVAGRPCEIDARLIGQPLKSLDTADAGAEVVPDGAYVPLRAGLFQIGSGADARLIAVNAPHNEDETAEAEAQPYPKLPYGLAPWLIGLALAVLAVEAIITARRKGRLPQISLLRVATLALLIAAALNLPLPWYQNSNGLAAISADDGIALGRDSNSIAIGPGTSVLAGADGIGSATGAARIPYLGVSYDLAAAMIPPDRQAHVVLSGDAQRDVGLERTAAGGRTMVHHLPLVTPGADEVYVQRLDMPHLILPGEPLTLTALVESTAERSVEIELLVDGEVIASQDQALTAGSNRIETVLPGLENAEALIELRVVHDDAYPQNNVAGRIVSASPARPIAVVAADPVHGEAFTQLLSDQGLEASLLTPGKLPFYAEDWLGYGGIVLLNTPALSLTTSQQVLIEQLVAEHGMGLVMLGGANSFGPGGYFGTPLEALSPLSSRVPQDAPEVAMVFVLDRSGSMQQAVGQANRLDVAKMATVSATELLNPQSRVGIIVFDAEARTVLPMTRLADAPGAVEASLSGFDPGGGTDILPGLKEAIELLRTIDAQAKHVVVMTDGLSQPTDYTQVVGELRELGATVSAVAIGQGADSAAAREIAALGGGAAHVSSDFAALPSILSQEAMLLSSPVEEGTTQPVWTRPAANYLSALPRQLPPLFGFVGTTAKDDAQLFVTALDSKERDMPILASWRYGNGQVLALATDATGTWGEAWQRLPEYGALWKDILTQFQPITPRPGETLDLASNGDYLTLGVSALDDDGLPLGGQVLTATITHPDGGTTAITLAEAKPGHYEGRMMLGATGRYEIALGDAEDEAALRAVHYHSYSPLYDFSRVGGAAALAAATGGGEISADAASALASRVEFAWERNWPVWCLIAFALFLLELTLRYRGFSSRRPATASVSAPNGLRPEGTIR